MTKPAVALLAAFALAFGPWIAFAIETCLHNCHVSVAGEQLTKRYEGFFPFRYRDPAGYLTIGYGHRLKPGEIIDEPLLGEAPGRLLRNDLQEAAVAVNSLVSVPLEQSQFDALSDFTFNVGVGKKGLKDGFGVLKSGRAPAIRLLVNTGHHADVPAQFKLWVYAGGKKLKGLVARRQAEAELYSQGNDL